MQLAGKNALVTGANRGIGQATAVALADRGANVAVHYHLREEEAKKTRADIKRRGVKTDVYRADVRDVASVQLMIEEVSKRFGGIDILVNNAGVTGAHSSLAEIDGQEWGSVLDINLKGVFHCCQAAAAELRRNRGKIVNISSIAGKMGGTIGCHYAASKAGVIGLTFALASELAPEITVNAVAPGPVDTDFISEDIKRRLSSRTPFGRIAKPEEIAHAVIFLLENDYVSGEVVDVNAGRYMD
ncbi:MAG: 3-oxoacyl-ACP reductase family protein [Candidatus Aminicenantes bacterium]|jgi:3-oxoacyl-[acyl-carrier protein] reductase